MRRGGSEGLEPLVFEQTKHRNDRPAWKVFRSGVLLGRVSHLGDAYRFRAHDRLGTQFTASELRELAQFIEEARDA